MDKHNNPPPLPVYARLPINRCNLPADVLGGLAFQQHPFALYIDGVHELHKQLFSELDNLTSHDARAAYFMDYMTVQFRFEHPEDTGLEPGKDTTRKRDRADYLMTLRGWLFDPNGQEAAVLKSWVETRFGLLTRYHNGLLYSRDGADDTNQLLQAFLKSSAHGLYATNALESQLDLVFSYCQYELTRTYSHEQHITLFRGVNRLYDYEVLQQDDDHHAIVLLNNLNSFTLNRERADEFGDYTIEIDACWQKILFYTGLLPGLLIGEEEVLMIGGVYEVTIST